MVPNKFPELDFFDLSEPLFTGAVEKTLNTFSFIIGAFSNIYGRFHAIIKLVVLNFHTAMIA